jgi:signal transduction histidine kinase
MYADRTRFIQILNNLLSNAAKFTSHGRIFLRVREETLDGKDTLRIEIEDEGIGISEEQQTRLFQPFSQAEATTTRKYGGTGLGLSIVKRLIDLMEGNLVMKSTVNKGTTFIVHLSMGVSEAAAKSNSDVPRKSDV